MKQKRVKDEDEELDEESVKRFCEAGPSDQLGNSRRESNGRVPQIECLEYELQQPHINVQELGRIITEGMLEKTLNDELLRELTKKLAKNVPTMPNINIWNLSDDLSKGTIDSRLVVVGNAFLWNLLKSSMTTIRDKFDHYQFKMSTISATNSISNAPIEFLTTRIQNDEHIIGEDTIFKSLDLLDVYNSIVFRKNGDLQSRSKQFVKSYFAIATDPKCAIWHYSLRSTGASHKKWLQNIPDHVLDSMLRFLLSLAGLGNVELEQGGEEEEGQERGGFFMSLGPSDEIREATFARMKLTREQLVSKFRQCVTDALNETREMPYNTITHELMAPPRGKPIDSHHCVTWRVYESLIKRCDLDPSKENLDAKRDLDKKLHLVFNHRGEQEEEEEEGEDSQQQQQQQRQLDDLINNSNSETKPGITLY